METVCNMWVRGILQRMTMEVISFIILKVVVVVKTKLLPFISQIGNSRETFNIDELDIDPLETFPRLELDFPSDPFDTDMENFAFSSERRAAPATTFNGPMFYNVYKDAEFLRIDTNVEQILSRGFEMRQKLNSVPDGHTIVVEGMNLERNTPLMIKKTAKGVKVEDFEFTYNRLAGLVAAYAYDNRHRFPTIQASEARALGLVWDNSNTDKCKMFLSAISGTEHLIDQFSYWPLICGIKKFQLKKMPIELVIKMAKVKNANGDTMAKLLKANLVTTKRLWLMFPNSSIRDLETIINTTPELKRMVSQC